MKLHVYCSAHAEHQGPIELQPGEMWQAGCGSCRITNDAAGHWHGDVFVPDGATCYHVSHQPEPVPMTALDDRLNRAIQRCQRARANLDKVLNSQGAVRRWSESARLEALGFVDPDWDGFTEALNRDDEPAR